MKDFCKAEHVYSLAEASAHLANEVEHLINNNMARAQKAGLILTGGSSIGHFFPALQKMNVAWNKLNITVSDERLVPKNDPASNEGNIYKNFFNDKNAAAKSRFISLQDNFLQNCDGEYEDIKAILPHSVAILSMGADGHVASLFTEDDLKGQADLTYVQRPDFKRVSLSYQSLLSIPKTYILVYGDNKLGFYKRINMNDFYLKELFIKSEIILIKE